jgi:hypothetical protein
MMRLIDGTTARDYTFVVPHTGVTISAITMTKLADAVRDHLDANGFQSVVLPQVEIEDKWCREHPGSCQEEHPANRPMVLQQVITFTKTMLHNLAKGGQRVDQVVANERAAICASCVNNVDPVGCAPCLNSGAAAAAIGILIGDRTTSSENALKSCAMCGCMNKAQVWFPIQDLQAGMSQALRNSLPDNCWKK